MDLLYELPYSLTCAILSVLYMCIFVCSVVYLRYYIKHVSFKITIHFWFILLVFINTLLRVTYFVLPSYFDTPFSKLSPLERFLVEFVVEAPALISYTTFSLLNVYINDLYHGAVSASASSGLYKSFCLWSNITFYCVSLALWVTVSLKPQYANRIEDAAQVLFMTACILATIGFAKYGFSLVKSLRRFPIVSVFIKRQMLRVTIVTSICAFAFLGRGTLQFVTMIKHRVLEELPWFVLTYYLLLDILPYSVLLFILNDFPKKSNSTRNSFRYYRV
ncbi:hypothetical protein GEMRC1_001559 [Eukaryota sp. GEM-RC1]